MSRQASSQAAWALLTEGVTKARLESHRLRHLMSRAIKLIEGSDHKEHFFQVAGDIILAAPKRMDHLDLALDRTSLALAKMGTEFLDSRLPLSDKMLVEEAVASAFGGGGARHSLRDRVVARYMEASISKEALAALRAIWDSGTPPEGGRWSGGPPEIKINFTSLKAQLKQKPGRDGMTSFDGKILLGKDTHGDTSGAYAESYLFVRFLKAFPGTERAMAAEFVARVMRAKSKVAAQLKKHYQNKHFQDRILDAAFGLRESEEWEGPFNLKLGRVDFVTNDVQHDSRYGEWWMPLEMGVKFEAKKKAPVGEGPFTAMPDGELNQWIKAWEEMGPENFWMDGELDLPYDQALKMYRDQWRKMPPRQQIRMMDNLQRWV